MQAERHRGQYIDPTAGKIRVRDIAEGWASGLTHLKVSTATRYRGLLRRTSSALRVLGHRRPSAHRCARLGRDLSSRASRQAAGKPTGCSR